MATWVKFKKKIAGLKFNHNILLIVKWAPTEYLGFFDEIYIESDILKIEGLNEDNFGDLPFN